MSTIFAQATAPGKAGVAIIRISGDAAFEVADLLDGSLPEPRMAAVRTIRKRGGEPVDRALVLCFGQGRSFTGEDVVEFHLHGSVAIVRKVLDMLTELPGYRMAEAGEFTRRALANDRLDLTQVEGLGDLIEAETELQRKQAQRVFDGALRETVSIWRQDLLRAASLLEAVIDFADEDVPMNVLPEVHSLLLRTRESIQEQIAGSKVAERIRAGFEVAIVGPPNVGKSTLLNAVAKREAALTSEIAGTTRDIIEVRMDLDGLPVTFLDTAGLRDTEDAVEAMGVNLARSRSQEADLRVFLLDDRDDVDAELFGEDDICLYSKADQRDDARDGVSGITGLGVQAMLDRVADILSRRSTGDASATRERHRLALMSGAVALRTAISELESGEAREELAAMEVRSALHALDTVIGKVDVEMILGDVFASFCIGK